MKYEIKSRFSGEVIFSLECGSLKLCVEAAVEAGVDLGGADLRDAYLRGAYLRGADLGGADLRDAYLRGADLRGAYLRDADLRDADLRGADLRGAYLRGADLRGAEILDGGQEKRGYRFLAWNNNGVINYTAGCRWWNSYQEAIDHYDENYEYGGDRHECIARLELLRALAIKRWPDAKEVTA